MLVVIWLLRTLWASVQDFTTAHDVDQDNKGAGCLSQWAAEPDGTQEDLSVK